MAKNILPRVDVVGKNISWRFTPDSPRMYGEVIAIKYRPGPDPRYPKGSKGYANGIRKLFTMMSVMMADGRVFTLSGEPEDLKKIGAMPDTGE